MKLTRLLLVMIMALGPLNLLAKNMEKVDTVRTLDALPSGDWNVSFKLMAAYYKASGNDAELIKVLKVSKDKNLELTLTIDPIELRITKAKE
jgi:hypothetical protein